MSIGTTRPQNGRIARTAVASAGAATLVVLATLALAGPAAAASGSGPEGQTIVVSKSEGLDPAGETITIHGEGFDLSKGIYVVLCVDKGAGQQPTPCLGGVDMEGAGGSSAWISSNPPSYGEGLATPFTEAGGKGSFDVQLTVSAKDQFTDCLDTATAPNGCVVGTRADHTRTGDRSADVLVPVTFAASPGGDDGATPPPGGAGSPSPSASGTPGADKKDLAETGAGLGLLAPVGVAAALGGSVLLAVRRRSSTSAS